jgi:hypothetical protein
MLLLITEMDEGDPEFQQLTEEEIASSVVMASALEEGSDIELNEPQEFTIKLLSSARDSIDAVISYVGSSTNRELQAYYEHLSTVREILINPLNAELNPTCHLLALLGAHSILHISRIRVKHAAHSPFFSSKCRLFHNATFFGSCIIYILHTECAKIYGL